MKHSFLKFVTVSLLCTLSLVGCAKSGTPSATQVGQDAADKAFNQSMDLSGVNADKISETEQGKRIVMDSVALTGVAAQLDLKLAGVPTSRLGKMPKRYANITQIGLPMNPNMEVLKSINPTKVYVPDSLEDWTKEGFTNNGIAHEYVNLRSVDNLYAITQSLAKEYQREEKFIALQRERDAFLATYEKKLTQRAKDGKKPPRVLILMGLPGNYLVATENSYAGSLVKMAGGENIIQNTDEEFVTPNLEKLLAENPDFILRTAHAMPENVQQMFKDEFKNNKAWKYFKAVKDDRVVDLDSKLFGMTAQFDYPQALTELYEVFYGE